MKSRIPAETEKCTIANPAASCAPDSDNRAATTMTKVAVRANEDSTGGNLSFNKIRCAGCNSVANNAAISNGIISSEICDSSHNATALMVIMSNTRQDQAAATTTPYGRSAASISWTRAVKEDCGAAVPSFGWLPAGGVDGAVT